MEKSTIGHKPAAVLSTRDEVFIQHSWPRKICRRLHCRTQCSLEYNVRNNSGCKMGIGRLVPVA